MILDETSFVKLILNFLLKHILYCLTSRLLLYHKRSKERLQIYTIHLR